MYSYDLDNVDLVLSHFQHGGEVRFWLDGLNHLVCEEPRVICQDRNEILYLTEQEALEKMQFHLGLRLGEDPNLQRIVQYHITTISDGWNDLIVYSTHIDEIWPLTPWIENPYGWLSDWSWAYRLDFTHDWLKDLEGQHPVNFVDLPCVSCMETVIEDWTEQWFVVTLPNSLYYWVPFDRATDAHISIHKKCKEKQNG